MRRLLTLFTCTVLLAGCAHTPPGDGLYRELGESDGIARIVDGLIRNMAVDPRTRGHFRGIHIAGFRERLEIHLCAIAGGPCTWNGRDMQEIHADLDIDSSAFNGLVEGLEKSMDDLDIPRGTQNAFLARLAPMQKDIVALR